MSIWGGSFAHALAVFISGAGAALSADEIIVSTNDYVPPQISQRADTIRGVCKGKPVEVVFRAAGPQGPAQVEVFYAGASLMVSKDTAFARDWTAADLLVRKRFFCHDKTFLILNAFGVKMVGGQPTFVRSEVFIKSGKVSTYVPPTADDAAYIQSFLY